jgi:sugar phosphate isomerase/epimerase
MDLCWTVAAGQDPIEYFKKHPNRIHDGAREGPEAAPVSAAVGTGPVIPTSPRVGSGIIDWKGIIAAAYDAKVQHYFVEHDAPASPFDSIQVSLEYLQRLRSSPAAPAAARDACVSADPR